MQALNRKLKLCVVLISYSISLTRRVLAMALRF
jgi:hypothetical protein